MVYVHLKIKGDATLLHLFLSESKPTSQQKTLDGLNTQGKRKNNNSMGHFGCIKACIDSRKAAANVELDHE